jgi:hypothetical protein
VIAADFIVAAGIDFDTLAAALPRVDPARVPVRAAPRWFRAVWARGISAVAMPWAVYLHPRHLDRPSGDLGRLIVHELTHVDQWRRLGLLRWARAYLGDYLRGRRRGMSHEEAYRRIALEVEARAVSHRVVGCGG